MPIVIKMNNDKSLQMSKVTNIYQSENNADDFLILLPQLYESNNLRECTVTFNWKNINGEGNSTLLMFGEDLYKDTFLQATEPLTIMYTSVVGRIEIWLSVTNPSNELVLKTGSTFVDINSTNDIDGELSEQDLLILDDYLLQIQKLKDETTETLAKARLKSDPIAKIDLDAELQNTINNVNPPDIGDGNYVIIQGADIDDSTPSFAKVYSSQTTENKINNIVDSAISGLSGFSDENFTLEEKEKLSTIEPNANFFELTEVDANIVAENTEKNFVSVSEKSMFADKYTKSEIDNLLSSIVTGLVWKDSTGIIMLDDIVTKYPTPEPDWCVNTENEGTWLFNGDVWIKINNDKTPLSTEEVNGLMTWLDKKKLNSIEDGANKYNHPLNHSADMITTNSTRNFVTSAQLEIINNITTTINNAISNYRLKSTKIIESDLDSTLLAKIEVGGSGGVINDNITSISQTYSSFMINNKLDGLEDALSDELLAVSNNLQEIQSSKVDKVIGKELIETTKITKLDGVDDNAQVNVIEDIKVNGTSLTPLNKSIDINIPNIIAGDNITLVEDDVNHAITINAKGGTSGSNITDSEINGNILVDGNEVEVYTLPSDVAKIGDIPSIPDVSTKLEATNIKAGTNISLTVSGNDITINSTEGSGGSSVTDSDTNGNIIVDGSEIVVYTLPSDVARTSDIPNIPDVSTKLEIGNLIQGDNITLSTDGNNVTISANVNDSTNVEGSTTNGNILVDGNEVEVYKHPSTHDASMIIQDSSSRFVSDTEKATWEDKYTKSEVDNKLSVLDGIESSLENKSDVTHIHTELHTHSNKGTLDKVSESIEGVLLFDGKEIQGGTGGGVGIDDDNISIEKTYSSQKIENRLNEVEDEVGTKYIEVSNPLTNTELSQESPVGSIINHMGSSILDHYLVCDGSLYNIVDYPHLAKFILNTFGIYRYFGGDGVTTFAVPNLVRNYETKQLASITPIMTSNTTPSPYVVSASSIYYEAADSWRAFDGIGANAWVGGQSNSTAWVQMNFGKRVSICAFELTSRDNPYVNAPKKFTLEASNDGTTFTTIRSYPNETWTRNQTKLYVLNVNITYQYYRINVSESTKEGGIYISIGQLKFLTNIPQYIKYEPTYYAVNQYGGFEQQILWEGELSETSSQITLSDSINKYSHIYVTSVCDTGTLTSVYSKTEHINSEDIVLNKNSGLANNYIKNPTNYYSISYEFVNDKTFQVNEIDNTGLLNPRITKILGVYGQLPSLIIGGTA